MIDNNNDLHFEENQQKEADKKNDLSASERQKKVDSARDTSEKFSEKISKVEVNYQKPQTGQDQVQSEQPKETTFEPKNEKDLSIGKLLSDKRKEQGLSYEQIADTTKIRKKYLIALENDEFKVIPNLLAARGFLKIYASFLDLDVKKLVTMFNKLYPEDAAVVNAPTNEMSMVDRQYRKDLLTRSLKSTNSSSYDYSKKMKRKKTILFLTTSLGIILLIGAIIGTSNHYLKRTVGDLKKNPKTKNQMEVPVPKVTPEQMRNNKSNVESVYVTAKAINRTWIRVVMDGRVVFSGNMDRGNSKTWTGSQYISIKASRPDRLELMVNGEFVGVMDKEPKLKEVTYYLSTLSEKQKKDKDRALQQEEPAPVVETAPEPITETSAEFQE